MSQIKTRAHQVGISATATNNFTLQTPAVPDGTMKLARGLPDATTQDILTVLADGRVSFPQGIAQFTQNLVGNGWQKFPSGLIVQWFYALNSNNIGSGWSLTNYPIAFPSAVLNVLATPQTSSAKAYNVGHVNIESTSQTGVAWVAYDGAAAKLAANNLGVNFVVIGY
jgi:hypothetical protein